MKKIEWPEGKNFAVCLSHDVDRVQKSFQAITNFFIEKRPYHLVSLFNKKNPYWSFDKIIELEKKYNIRSTFFFLKETKKLEMLNPSSYGLSCGYYDWNNPKITEIIKKLDDGGWEIGLHGSYRSYQDEKLLLEEKKGLERVLGMSIIGIRQHFLNLDIPRTWEMQKKIGFKYDTSFGYQDKIGFREDKIIPFKPFNGDFLVFPLTAMDSTIFSNYNKDKTRWKKISEVINIAEKKGGVISFLWHQRVFNEKEFPGWSKMYEKIIRECKEKDAWIVPCREVYKYIMNK